MKSESRNETADALADVQRILRHHFLQEGHGIEGSRREAEKIILKALRSETACSDALKLILDAAKDSLWLDETVRSFAVETAEYALKNAAPQATGTGAADASEKQEPAAAAPDTRTETACSRNDVIEQVAKHIEDARLTYMGPDPGVVKDLKFLIVAAIRDMKKGA